MPCKYIDALCVHMPGNFLGLSSSHGKNVKKSGNFGRLGLENLESLEIFVKGVLRTLGGHWMKMVSLVPISQTYRPDDFKLRVIISSCVHLID